MKSAEYWQRRALEREEYSRQIADEALRKKIFSAYNRAEKQINSDIDKIFKRFMANGELTKAQAKRLLSTKESEEALAAVKKEVKSIKDPAIKKKALSRLNAPAYSARINRLDALRASINAELAKVADVEKRTLNQALERTVESTYYRSIYDTQLGTGLAFDFSTLPKGAINAIVAEKYAGAHFSSRVWADTRLLASRAYDIISSGIVSGKSVSRMSADLADTMQSGKYAATRLVRTETNRVHNAAERASYEEQGVEKYEYLATLDVRTCDVCGSLDRKVFLVSSIKVGVNYPPMHPNDRCTTVVHFGVEALDNLKRRAKDPKTGKSYFVEPGTSFEEWKEKVLKRDGLTSLKKGGSIFNDEGYNPDDIIRAIQSKAPNFVTTNKNSREYEFGVAIESVKKLDGIYDIKAHGDYDGVKIYGTPVDAKELAKIILCREDYNGEPIRLLSCNTGKMVNDTCVAKELANLLGVEVFAPNDVILTDGKGWYGIGRDRFKSTGEFVRFKPK